jgi:GTP-binding protein HflX
MTGFGPSGRAASRGSWTVSDVPQERAVLVGVDISTRSSLRRPGAEGARAAALAASSASEETETETGQTPLLTAGNLSGTSTELSVDASLVEFRELVESAGGQVVAQVLQRRSKPDAATLIGAGKVEEIAGIAAANQADLVVFDHDLTPTQLRNLESQLPCLVLDRTQLILDIFARHARTREGQLQVDLAQL